MKKWLILMVMPLMIGNEFVVSKKDREQKKLAKLSYARLKEELVYRCDPAIKMALRTVNILAEYQKLVVMHQLPISIFNQIADIQRSLSDAMLILVNGVSDLAQDSRQTGFGKAGKKELKIYCDNCYELELLLEDICKELTTCLNINIVDKVKKSCQDIDAKLPKWQKEIINKSQLLS